MLLARAATLDRHPDILEVLVRGWLLAAETLRTRPLEAAEALAPRLNLAPSSVSAAFTGIRLVDLGENRRLLEGAVPPLAEVAHRLLDSMLANKFLALAPDIRRLFDARIVTRVTLPDGG